MIHNYVRPRTTVTARCVHWLMATRRRVFVFRREGSPSRYMRLHVEGSFRKINSQNACWLTDWHRKLRFAFGRSWVRHWARRHVTVSSFLGLLTHYKQPMVVYTYSQSSCIILKVWMFTGKDVWRSNRGIMRSDSGKWRENLTQNKRGNVCINVTLRRVPETVFAIEKQHVLHILSEWIRVCVALVIQQAKLMRRYYIIICDLSSPTIFFHIIS